MLQRIFDRDHGINRQLAVGTLVVALAATSVACQEPVSKPAPTDILIITIDTLRADSLEPYGAIDTLTPNIARFAEQGVVYE